MNSINRFNPVTGINTHGVRMQACDDGRWVSYDMHKQEIASLQARLKALESMQKQDFFYHLQKGLGLDKIALQAIESAVKELTRNGDPCHSTVDAFVSELAAGPGKTVVDDGAKFDYLTKDAKFTFGSNFGEGKALTMSTAKMEPRSGGYGYADRHMWAVSECESARDRKVAVCYYAGGNEFINGCEYEYEVDYCKTDSKPRFIHIVQDAFVSDLKGDYRWDAVKFGKVNIDGKDLGDAYAIINPDGVLVAQFYIK